MSLDGAFLHIVKTELINKNLINSRVDKIHQPAREEIVISLRTGGGTEKLLFSANAVSARVCLTSKAAENPKTPPMFCMLMRKHLGGGKLVGIIQDGLERILAFDFLCMNEIGDMVKIRIAAEIMGRNSNVILMTKKEEDNEWRIIDSVKRVTDEISSVRRILPNAVYVAPPRENRIILSDSAENGFNEKAVAAVGEYSPLMTDKAILKAFEGVSPVLAREWSYYVTRGTDITAGEMLNNKNASDRFIFFMNKLRKTLLNIENEKPCPCAVAEKTGNKLIDFSFVNIEQYGGGAVILPYQSANSLLDAFFSEKAETERLKQNSGDLLKTLMQIYERISRRLETQKTEHEACKERDKLRLKGDIISANIYAMEKGLKFLEAEDYETGKTVKIPLDAKLSPSQNAQKYYSEYKKLDTAEKKLTELISSGEQELEYIDSVFDAAARANCDAELAEIKEELSETGYIKKSRQTGKAKKEKLGKLPPLRFVSSDGTEILAGRNNLQNDKLTLKTAQPHDLWLHTQNIHGSHIIIKCVGKPADKTIEEAAIIAAYCSKGRNSGKIPVDYTEARYVKKPAGARPGMVIYTHNKTLLVEPDEETYNRLKANP